MTDGVLSKLVAACRAAAASDDPVAGFRRALEPIAAAPAAALREVPEFEGEDHALLSEDGLSVFLVRQSPNTAGPPHDHGMVAVIAMLDGVEIHRHYRRRVDGEGVALDRETRLEPGGVLALGARDVHAIANPDNTPSIGIHVYLGDIAGCDRTLWNPVSGAATAFTVPAYDSMVTAYR